jgi:site-specific DNA recombinase
VRWREETFAGRHEPLVDEDTFARAPALLAERGEDFAARHANTSNFLLSGLIRCGRCRRAYVGMSAKGYGGTYRYYACSGRQKLGRSGCDGQRISRERLEAAVLCQLAELYRDGTLIGRAIEQTTAQRESERADLAVRRTALAKEIQQAERALERYHHAFETGHLGAELRRPRVRTRRAPSGPIRARPPARPALGGRQSVAVVRGRLARLHLTSGRGASV